jgi:small subunit ribosomal protein S5e
MGAIRRGLTARIEVKDISLTDYINVNHAVYVPHTAGRYAKKQFAKGRMPIVERLINACVDDRPVLACVR